MKVFKRLYANLLLSPKTCYYQITFSKVRTTYMFECETFAVTRLLSDKTTI